MMELMQLIRDVPDFPQKGIIFKDITPLLANPSALRHAVEHMANPFRDHDISSVVAIEARGYILGGPVALALGTGFVPVRKIGKLPWRTYQAEYALEYGSSIIEMHEDSLHPGQDVLIVDDVLATGGTLEAAAHLVEQAGARVVGMSVLVELTFLGGRERLKDYNLFSVLQY